MIEMRKRHTEELRELEEGQQAVRDEEERLLEDKSVAWLIGRQRRDEGKGTLVYDQRCFPIPW
jgi:hypothetical protein